MTKTKNHFAAISALVALVLFLLAATPALAKEGNEDGFNIGHQLKVRLFGNKEQKHNDNSASASTSGSVEIQGTVTAVSGTAITIAGKNGASYSVNAASASFRGHENTTLSISDIVVGDSIKVAGTLDGMSVVAIRVTEKDENRDSDKNDTKGDKRAIGVHATAGIVTSVSGSSFVIDPFGKKASTSITSNASTTFGGAGTSSAAIASGSHVVVFGAYSSTTNSISAQSVIILNKSWGWLKHLFLR